MTDTESIVMQTQTEDLSPQSPAAGLAPSPATGGVTIINDIQYDTLILLNNAFWGQVSAGYVRVNNSVTLPSIVNVDAYAAFAGVAGVWMTWPGPSVYRNVKKINLTPGQSYNLSTFS